MFCRICGISIPEHKACCDYCGTPVQTTVPNQTHVPAHVGASDSLFPSATPSDAFPEYTPYKNDLSDKSATIQKPDKKRNLTAIIFAAVSVLLAVALLLTLFGVIPASSVHASNGSAVSSQSFDTPEDAINNFIVYLKANDIDGILSTSAINNMAKGFDYTYFSNFMGEINPIGEGYLPTVRPDFIKYNELGMTEALLSDVYRFTVSFNVPMEFYSVFEGHPSELNDEKYPELLNSFDTSLMADLEIIHIKNTVIHTPDGDKERRNILSQIFGAQDVQYRAVLYQYNGKFYVGGFAVMKYNGKWQIYRMQSSVPGVPAIPIDDPSEFDDWK